MGKDREIVWKKFYKECYINELKQFQLSVFSDIEKNRKNYINQFRFMLKDFMRSLSQYDFFIVRPIGCIELSFLRYSAYTDKLQLAFEAYDKRQDMGECLAGYQLDLDWFSEKWMEHKNRLLKAREEVSWTREIRVEDIYVMLQDTIQALIALLTVIFKYSLEGCELWEEYQKLNISKEFFYISLGEYRDRQYLLYVCREKFDIFMIAATDTCRYGKFEKCIYRDKTIEERDIRNSLFDMCTFEKTKIAETLVTDCRFYDCTFYDCDMSGLDFTGAVFINCKFDECNLQNAVWYDETRKDDFYRKTYISNCIFTRCNVEEKTFGNCQLEHITIDKGERNSR